jgi:hypothetical protein
MTTQTLVERPANGMKQVTRQKRDQTIPRRQTWRWAASWDNSRSAEKHLEVSPGAGQFNFGMDNRRRREQGQRYEISGQAAKSAGHYMLDHIASHIL